MEQHLFTRQLQRSKTVSEETSYLKMLLYTDNDCNTVEQEDLPLDELQNFIDGFEMEVYRSPILREDVKVAAKVKLILQVNAKHPDTFRPDTISLPPLHYESMIKKMNLPTNALELTAGVGPLFWWDFVQKNGKKRLDIIFRKADVEKMRKTRGWELILSHDIEKNTTTGFYKGTGSSNMADVLESLKQCADNTYHPLLIPLLIFEMECMAGTELRQRTARAWVRSIENQLGQEFLHPTDDSHHLAELHTELLRRDIVECHAQVLWKAPKDYTRILQSFRACLRRLGPEVSNIKDVAEMHQRFGSRVDFLEQRFESLGVYMDKTLMRLSMQQDALVNVIARQENRLTVRLAGEQRALAYATKNDSTAMKALSLLGAIFLPGAYVASILSTTFFDFHDSADLSSAVSPKFWLYWVVVIPFTVCVVAAWYVWERQRKKKTHEVAEALKQQGVDVDQMEAELLAAMRERVRNSGEERYA
ncbi:hypothetical protein FJTKL_06588 [Diaporthe vaccinii]|uniref:Uncharacterized protein n=2 Tax=Diaporthe vaccinii TaxID=105482 RepID=A0ABR4DR70_9PEZI